MARKTNVLLIDDDPTVRESLGQALAFENYQVLPAANTAEALRACHSNQVDIALLDLNLADENGWETLERLTSVQPHLAVIVMSARPDQFAESMSGAVEAFMEKPLDLPTLFRKLAELAVADAKH